MKLLVGYTIKYDLNMLFQLYKSLHSVLRFVDKKNIVIIYTKQEGEETDGDIIDILGRYGNVIVSSNITKPFVFIKDRGASNYGESVQLFNLNSDSLIMLDCDTIIKKDITELLDFDYDVYARIGSGYPSNINISSWDKLFGFYGKKPIPMYNKGFMIFKNKVHNELFSMWKELINSNFPNPVINNFPKEQIALAIAMSGYNIKNMDKSIHSFGWNGEKFVDSYVYHYGSGKNMKKNIKNLLGLFKR